MPDQQETLPAKLAPITEKIKEYLPKMELGSQKALSSLEAKYELIKTAVEDYDGAPSEEIEAVVTVVTSTLTGAKNAYDKWSEWRKEITGPLDDFKKELMEFEKVVAYDGKTDNYYTKIRNFIVQIENKKLAYKEAEEKKAKAKKDLENYKVDLATSIKKNLSALLINRVKEVNEGSRKFFDDTPLEKFDERAKAYTATKIKLKQEMYDTCFNVTFDSRRITKSQFDDFIAALKLEEKFDTWDANVTEAITPTVNEWRAKIPAIKEQKLAIANEKDEEAKAALEKQKKDEDDAEALRKQDELTVLAKEVEKDIESEGDMNKMQNEFVEQVSVQELETAPTKKVYVVTDEKLFVKGFCTAIYHAFSHPDFPGMYKRDKNKRIVTDPETGDPQIMDHAKWFFDFVASNCDTDLDGMELKRIAKVTIRK